MKINDFVEVSLKDGAKFVFQVDSNMIVYECSPLSGKEYVSVNRNIRRWAKIAEMDNRYLRVVLLEDGETVHHFSTGDLNYENELF